MRSLFSFRPALLSASLGLSVACGSSAPDGDDDFDDRSSSSGGENGIEQGSGGSGGNGLPGAGGLGASGGSDGSGTGGASAVPVDCSGITAAGYELCDSSEQHCGAVFVDSSGCTAVCAAAGLTCVQAWENLEDACARDESLPPPSCDSGHQSDYCECGAAVSPGSGGGDGSGGAQGSGGSASSTADLSILDPVPGWASEAGGTTGGGTNLAGAVTVNNMTALKAAASGTGAAIILVEPGTYAGTLGIGANKTIIGKGPGVLIQGNMSISGSGSYNVIVRNLAVKGDPCGSYDECRAGSDAVYIGNGAHHVWLDHIDIADGQDGNCDITQGGDYVTVSWSRFRYTYNKEHRFSNLIAGSDDEPNSVGKLRISYMYSWWGELVNQRSPRGRFGRVHMVNNYHSSQDTSYVAGPGVDAQFLVENCFYEINSGRPAFSSFGDSAAWKGVGNEGNAEGLNSSQGTVFTPPYTYTKLPASQVKAAVTDSDCGAGNSCTFE